MLRRSVAGVGIVVFALLVGLPRVGNAWWGVPAPQPVAEHLVPGPPPLVDSRAWIVYDDTYGEILAAHQPDERRSVASTTKMMTALVVLESVSLEEQVTISERAAAVGGSEIGLVAGEEPWTVEQLLNALLLHSANDAAVALAEHVAGSLAEFANMMNQKAQELELDNSRFANPHGLDQSGHYSTARDLLTIALAGMQKPIFAQMVGIESAPLPPSPEGTSRVALNTNLLLGTYPGILGLKTGFTSQAGLCLVTAAQRDNRRIFTVVLGAEDHFVETAQLLDYGFSQFNIMTLVETTDDGFRPLGAARTRQPQDDTEVGFITEVTTPRPPATIPLSPADDRTDTSADLSTVPSETDTSASADNGATPVEDPPEFQPATRTVADPDLPGFLETLGWVVRYIGLRPDRE